MYFPNFYSRLGRLFILFRVDKMATNRLSVVDYVVFALVLAISGGIGIYYAFKQRKSSTTDFLLGGRSMSILPVTLSLTASFMSAITLLGTPAEIYVFTTIYSDSLKSIIFAGKVNKVRTYRYYVQVPNLGFIYGYTTDQMNSFTDLSGSLGTKSYDLFPQATPER